MANYKLSTAEIMQQVKGSSSHWINKNNIVGDRFGWQDGFGAFSVSQSGVSAVKAYIANQKSHHAKTAFADEYEQLFGEL